MPNHTLGMHRYSCAISASLRETLVEDLTSRIDESLIDIDSKPMLIIYGKSILIIKYKLSRFRELYLHDSSEC